MFSDLDKAIIKEIQGDLPLVAQPYREIALRLGISEQTLLEKIKEFQEQGYIRRFGAALRHREMGLKANPMIIWQVPEARIEEVGNKLASFARVTHCYHRPMLPKLPYNVFSMIHAETKEECSKLAKEMAEIINIDNYDLLYSEKELKKTSMKYFMEG
ncbi:MAG: transcriptional regulator [Peptococcaceae bacterium BICA1-8]|nr:MAG: transcriptional regulator [Peptococcaceae bacterium BICA1-8]